MSAARRALAGLAVLVLVVLAFLAWRLLWLPGPMAFAGGQQVSLADYKGASPTGVPAELTSADLVTRGKYLTAAADCAACHTAPGGQPFAGGLAFHLPFGTLYTPNITPDKETGIGNWSNADFLRAVHRGIAADGRRLYPAFPYASYTLLTDDDVLAIRAYLATIPAMHQPDRPNTFSFPYNQRWLMVFWSGFFNSDARFQPVAERSAAWNRGAYLVEALEHCGECHTPRNPLQARDTRQKFAGGVAEGWNAYNITSDPASGVGGWTGQALASYLSTGFAADHGSASGPMNEAVQLSLSQLTPGDIQAIVTYLRTVPPIQTGAAPPMAGPAPVLAAAGPSDNKLGKRIFEGACASCHSWNGQGAIIPAAQLTGVRAVNDPTGTNIVLMVLHGAGAPAGGHVFMPAFASSYTNAEIAAVANYVSARFGAAPSQLTAQDVAKLRND